MTNRWLVILLLFLTGLSVALGISVGKIGTELDEYRIAGLDWKKDRVECEEAIERLRASQKNLAEVNEDYSAAEETKAEQAKQIKEQAEELELRDAEISRLKAQIVRLQSRVPASADSEE